MLPDEIAAWSKMWCQVQAHVQSITVQGYPNSRPVKLREWPRGIDALHGLQFLQLICTSVIGWGLGPDMDLADIAFVPHVSLYSEGRMFLKISKGTWRVLELECAGYCRVDIDDAKAFMEGTDTFSFIFNNSHLTPYGAMGGLITELQKARADMGMKLYYNMDTPLRTTHLEEKHGKGLASRYGNAPMMEVTNCQREGNTSESFFLSARLRYSGRSSEL